MKLLLARCVLSLLVLPRFAYNAVMKWAYTAHVRSHARSVGAPVDLFWPCEIGGLPGLEIGNNVGVMPGSFFRAGGGIRIGNNVFIARNFTCYSENHNYRGDRLPYDYELVAKPVVIEDNVWIGINVTVIPGVRIGEGAVIGAGAIVSQDVPPLAVVGSAPPHVIKSRDAEHYEERKVAKRFYTHRRPEAAR